MKKQRWDVIIDQFGREMKLVGAEVGVRDGETSDHLLSYFPDLFLFLVDPWSGYYLTDESTRGRRFVDDETKKMEYTSCVERLLQYSGRTKIIRKGSPGAAVEFENSFFDFVFIDGLHGYKDVLADIKAWWNKIKKGGVIFGHDYDKTFFGVVKAWKEFALENCLVLEKEKASMVLIRKTGDGFV